MNAAATHVVASIPEIALAYGVSDEFSFVFDRAATLFERRRDKLVSTVVSTFTAAYVLGWERFFGRDDGDGGDALEGPRQGGEKGREVRGLSMHMLPTFDGRAVCYPSWANLRDYLSWRQVDCHINNLYNTTFWALVQQGGMTHAAAEELLKGTVSGDKNEILWSRFGINYNNEPEMYRKGSVVFREYMLEDAKGRGSEVAGKLSTEHEQGQGQDDDDEESAVPEPVMSKTQAEKMRKARKKAKVVTRHVDIIRDEFWRQRPWIRSGKPGRAVNEEHTGP
ncbi:uncharacterized protein PV07_01337 [Cladophialophora immunda]|uniref:tRNA(His) guanylyltransferase n=1 Tax=Cladophialophora immunda TaxID=569365 RepID=A0A0D2CXI1_9EURO|nr:uncharacterized protein PV07_01337 [Cladophialophora immunda]KIW34560.1 hypothetical protein PV07_01337 [Cladophialophora immunda]